MSKKLNSMILEAPRFKSWKNIDQTGRKGGHVSLCWIVLIGLISFSTIACSPEKARALQGAAAQFKADSLAAIDAIENLMLQEVAPAVRTRVETEEQFLLDLNSLPADQPLTRAHIEVAIDPFRVDLGSVSEQRREFLRTLRAQYSLFASMYDDLAGGSFLAKKAVRESKEVSEKLTLQLAAFAESISDHPPQFLQRQSFLINQFDLVHKNSTLTKEERRRQLLGLREQWLALKKSEVDLQREVVEKCLKAATLGMKMRKLIDSYDKMSFEDIADATGRILDEAGRLTGNDMSSLKTRSQTLFDTIKNDPIWSSVAGQALDQINGSIRAGT